MILNLMMHQHKTREKSVSLIRHHQRTREKLVNFTDKHPNTLTPKDCHSEVKHNREANVTRKTNYGRLPEETEEGPRKNLDYPPRITGLRGS